MCPPPREQAYGGFRPLLLITWALAEVCDACGPLTERAARLFLLFHPCVASQVKAQLEQDSSVPIDMSLTWCAFKDLGFDLRAHMSQAHAATLSPPSPFSPPPHPV